MSRNRPQFGKTLNFPCVISGSNPSARLIKAISKYNHITLKANISTSEILELIESAHVNAMITFQSTGIKLKLLNSLYRGRFVVANYAMVDQTQLEDLCAISDSAEGIVSEINQCFQKDFSSEFQADRKRVLMELFDNSFNAMKLAKMLKLMP